MTARFGTTPGHHPYQEVTVGSSHLTIGSGDRHVMALHDPALSAQVMEQTYLALLPNAELEVLANAGHYPMFETPVALATAMEEFLGRE
jgi:pimeloyl-ACP methyl ester carboxylesterase